MKKNLVIDVSPLIYASYFALHEALSWWMVHGVLNSILTLVREEQPDTMYLCWGSRKNKKFDVYPAYKAQRVPTIKFDLKQSNQLINLFGNIGIPQLKMEGIEADQLIAAVANELEECTIISEDKDFFQLLTDKKLLLGKRRGLWDAKRVCYEYGVKEAFLFADMQALIGDTSDNIPRITSTRDAKQIVNTKGRLDQWLFDNPDLKNVPKVLANKLDFDLHQIKINYELVDLRQEQLKPEYFLPFTEPQLPFVKEKLEKMAMSNFVKRFSEFERLSQIGINSKGGIKCLTTKTVSPIQPCPMM